MRLLYHPDVKDISLTGILYALGDPVRLAVVQRLADKGELSCAALGCDVPKSTMSHHLRVLRESGIIYCRKEGTQHFNSLRLADLDALFPGLIEVILQAVERSANPFARSLVQSPLSTSLHQSSSV